MKLLIYFLLTFSYTLFQTSSAITDKVFCYYESGSVNYFAPEDIDINICTHINYAFLGVHENGSLRLDGNDDVIVRVSELKSKNPNLKLVFSVGGWGEDPRGFSHVAESAERRAVMADSALWYLQTYNFDGIDIDWEYPGRRGGTSADRVNFIQMLTTLRAKFDENGGYLLTTAVCFDVECGVYDVKAISDVVNYVNIMTYDIHSPAEYKTGQNSPLFPSSNDTDWEWNHSNCNSSVNNWVDEGTSAEKIILGLAFYGHAYTLADASDHGIGAPSTGDGRESGNYDNVCNLIDGWTEVWDEEQQVPYKYKEDQWIGYDNPRSIGLKVQFAKNRNLGGVMMWAVNLDDKDGSCGIKNALLEAIKNNL